MRQLFLRTANREITKFKYLHKYFADLGRSFY